jgi:7-cyano-7-deazaguanine synthase
MISETELAAGFAGISRALVLVSGGVDSTTLLHWVRRRLGIAEIRALSFAYGQRHGRELQMAEHQLRLAGVTDHRVIDIGFLAELTAGRSALAAGGMDVPDLSALNEAERRQPPTYVPHRNLLFLAVAAAAAEGAGIQDVFYGAQAQDEYGYWDCTLEFVQRLNAVLGLNRDRAVRVHAPFVNLSKGEVVKIGLALGADYAHTWTCYRGGRAPCGTCPSCVEREAAFRYAGVDDPLT